MAHIEAGLRSFDMAMPEEINGRLTDSISSLLLVTEQSGVENLKHEGVPSEKIFLVGDVMIDCLLRHRELAARSPILDRLGVRRNGSGCRPYGVLTLHRPSNVDDPKTLQVILSAVSALAAELPVFFPIHPRTRKNVESFGLVRYLTDAVRADRVGIMPLDPLGYLDFLSLNDRARIVLTDSGGIQEETTDLGVPYLTLRENTGLPATVEHGSNQVVGVDSDRILVAARSILQKPARQFLRPSLWDGKAAPRSVAIPREHLERDGRAWTKGGTSPESNFAAAFANPVTPTGSGGTGRFPPGVNSCETPPRLPLVKNGHGWMQTQPIRSSSPSA